MKNKLIDLGISEKNIHSKNGNLYITRTKGSQILVMPVSDNTTVKVNKGDYFLNEPSDFQAIDIHIYTNNLGDFFDGKYFFYKGQYKEIFKKYGFIIYKSNEGEHVGVLLAQPFWEIVTFFNIDYEDISSLINMEKLPNPYLTKVLNKHKYIIIIRSQNLSKKSKNYPIKIIS